MPQFKTWVEGVGLVIDTAGVVVIVVGLLVATVVYIRRGWGHWDREDVFRGYRQNLGRSILLGLELLVAADIVRTVAVRPTLESVGVLAGIVLIRTFLSMSIQLELEGRWPWDRGRPAGA